MNPESHSQRESIKQSEENILSVQFSPDSAAKLGTSPQDTDSRKSKSCEWTASVRNHPDGERLQVGTRYVIDLGLSPSLKEALESEVKLEVIVVSNSAKIEGAELFSSESDNTWMIVLASKVTIEGMSPGAEFSTIPLTPGEATFKVIVYGTGLYGTKLLNFFSFNTQVSDV